MKLPFEIKVGLKTCVSICKAPFSDSMPITLQIGIARMTKDALDYIEQLELERDALKRDLCTSCQTCKHWVKRSCVIERPISYECETCDGYEWRGVGYDKR